MEIKEVENLLSVSRSNIRFYEKEGLINPERRGNNYQDYSGADIAMLKKIIILRKLGCSVDEIAALQAGELTLSDALDKNMTRLKEEIEKLNGALETSQALSSEKSTFDDFDEEYYWTAVTQAEKIGKKFVDICRDCLKLELYLFDAVWKYNFFHDFKNSRQKYGVLTACGIMLLLCLIRGISFVLIWHKSFWIGFLYPVIIFAIGSAIILPIYIIGKKFPKAASVISVILLILCVGFLSIICLLLIYGIITLIFS